MSSIAETMGRFSYSRNGYGMVDEGCQVRIAVTTIDTVKKYVSYHVRVVNVTTKQAWEVVHRYSDFLNLRNDLMDYFKKAERKCPGCINYEKVIKLFEFPKKHLFSSRSQVVLNYRKRALRAFLALLSSHTFTPAPKCPCCSGFPFTALVDFLTNDPLNAPQNVGRSTERMSIDMIRQSIDVKDFINYIPITGEQIVDSNGAFTNEVKNEKHKQIREEIKERVRASGKNYTGIPKMDDTHTSPASSAPTTSFGSTSSDDASRPASLESAPSDADFSPPPAPVAKQITAQQSVNSKRQKRRSKKNTHEKLRDNQRYSKKSIEEHRKFSSNTESFSGPLIADQDEELDLTFAKKLNVALE
jgi:hypothetical protein